MAILVSGASGFLGRKLVKRLANMDKEMEFLIMRSLLTYYPDFNQTQVLLMNTRPIKLKKGHWMSTSNWFMQPGLMGQS
jgi:nucleoside-diphosphate-sugar epimerase|tara:strand:- start:14 stop:250 length:237 start_codon:yes stop_codon:yes gene_type:complete